MIRLFLGKKGSAEESGAVRALLARGLREELGITAPVAKNPGGQPYLVGHPELFISLSHDGDWLMAAVASQPLGCDITDHRRISSDLPGQVMGTGEQGTFSFYEAWALKESYIKMIGERKERLKDIVFSRRGTTVVPPAPAHSSGIFEVSGNYTAAYVSMEDPAAIDIRSY